MALLTDFAASRNRALLAVSAITVNATTEGSGMSLFTPEEQKAHQEKMRTMSPAEREAYRDEQYQLSRQRAAELGLTLPAEGRQTKVRKRNIVHILVNSRGQMMIDGDQYPIPALEDIARRKIRENDKVIMSVKIDPQAQYSVMIDVVDELMKAGSRRISLVPPEM